MCEHVTHFNYILTVLTPMHFLINRHRRSQGMHWVRVHPQGENKKLGA